MKNSEAKIELFLTNTIHYFINLDNINTSGRKNLRRQFICNHSFNS